jgi:thioredoxin 1
MKIITDQNFEELVANNDKPVVIDFFTTWCPPCKMLSPVIEKIAEDYAGKVEFVKMDLDQCPVTGAKFQVDRIPTVIFLKKGQIVSSFIGFREDQDIRDWVEAGLLNN